MEFQAYDKQIDTLSSAKIPDTVTQILWLNQPTQNSLLTSNAREIKLWKIQQKQLKKGESAVRNLKRGYGLHIPKLKKSSDTDYSSKLQHTFKSESETTIHKLSLNVDKENFIAIDIHSVGLWNLEKATRHTTFKLIDNKTKTGNTTSSAISGGCFNQYGQNSIFLYTQCTGEINICDFRERSDFSKRPSIQLKTSLHNNISTHQQYTNFLNYCSGAEFLPDSN